MTAAPSILRHVDNNEQWKWSVLARALGHGGNARKTETRSFPRPCPDADGVGAAIANHLDLGKSAGAHRAARVASCPGQLGRLAGPRSPNCRSVTHRQSQTRRNTGPESPQASPIGKCHASLLIEVVVSGCGG
jgi:hypothetical protein